MAIQVGDIIEVEYQGEIGTGIVTAVRSGRTFVRLTIWSTDPWRSPISGGTVPARCPRTYLLWVPTDGLTETGAKVHPCGS